jgi:iduronate 2-sulfatase
MKLIHRVFSILLAVCGGVALAADVAKPNVLPDVVAQLRALLAAQPEAKPQMKTPATQATAREATAGKPKPDRAAMFARRDQNNDGNLTREEFLAGQPDPTEAPKRFPLFDTNQDGVLSEEEFVTMGKR